MRYIQRLFVVLFAVLALCESANAAVIRAVYHEEPFFGNAQLQFDFGRPLSNILSVVFTMDPCNAFENELPRTCFDAIGLAEPVQILIADLSLILVPLDEDQIDLPLSQALVLTPALLADLLDGLIDASASVPLTGAAFVDFYIDVVVADVSEPGGLALLLLAVTILMMQRDAWVPNRLLRAQMHS